MSEKYVVSKDLFGSGMSQMLSAFVWTNSACQTADA